MATCLDCIHRSVCIKREKSISRDPMKCGYKCPDFKNSANVAEVKHGEWIEENHKSYLVHPVKYDDNGEPILQDYTSYKCSLCGRVEEHKEPYCNCGAKMCGQKGGTE